MFSRVFFFDKQFDVIGAGLPAGDVDSRSESVGFVPDELRNGVPSPEFILPADACQVIQCSERDMAQIPCRDEKAAKFIVGSRVVPIAPAFVSLLCDLR